MSVFMTKLKKRIPKVKLQTMNLSIGHRLFLLFLVGIVLGTFIMNFFAGDYATKIGIYSEYFINGVNVYGNSVDRTAFYVYCLKKYISEFCLILLLNLTPMGNTFNWLYCIYKGLVIAIFISSATLTYGAGGLLIYIISIFPHYFLYIPFLVFAFYISVRLAERIKEHKGGRIKLRAVIIILFLAIGTAFLEAYVNYFILKNAFC